MLVCVEVFFFFNTYFVLVERLSVWQGPCQGWGQRMPCSRHSQAGGWPDLQESHCPATSSLAPLDDCRYAVSVTDFIGLFLFCFFEP